MKFLFTSLFCAVFFLAATFAEGFSNIHLLGITSICLVLLLSRFVIIRYSILVFLKIGISSFRLNWQIYKNEVCIKKLKGQLHSINLKLRKYHSRQEFVKEIVEHNLGIWSNQIKLHVGLIDLCMLKLRELEQLRMDLCLLIDLRREIRKEPNSEKRLKKIENTIKKIDSTILPKAKAEIRKVIESLETVKRESKIFELNVSLGEMKAQVA